MRAPSAAFDNDDGPRRFSVRSWGLMPTTRKFLPCEQPPAALTSESTANAAKLPGRIVRSERSSRERKWLLPEFIRSWRVEQQSDKVFAANPRVRAADSAPVRARPRKNSRIPKTEQ